MKRLASLASPVWIDFCQLPEVLHRLVDLPHVVEGDGNLWAML
jgi:hypothetical protein